MAKEAKSADAAPAKKRKRRARKPKDEPVHYVFQVNDWDCHYGFRISDPKNQFDDGPYSDLATLTFSGDLMEPVKSKYSSAELTLSSRGGMSDEKWREPPSAIGSLGAYDETLTVYVFVPIEHMAMLVSLSATFPTLLSGWWLRRAPLVVLSNPLGDFSIATPAGVARGL